MNFIHEQGFDVKLGRQREFQRWLETHDDKLREACPEGIEYQGTYAAVQTSEKSAGSFRTLWKMESYGALDRFAAAMKEPSSFGRLVEEMTEFIDQAKDANWSSSLLKNAVAAAIWADHE